jgi:uncharacterized protein YkwD
MGNFNAFSILLISKIPVLNIKLQTPVLTNSCSCRHKTRKVDNTGNKHLATVLKILLFLFFTGCMNEMPYEVDMLAMINSARTSGYVCQGQKHNPVCKMKWDSQLEIAALIQCNYMDSVGELSHKWKDGTELKDRLMIVGYTSDLASENLAQGPVTQTDVLEAWLNSPEHCESIMYAGYDIVAVARKGVYWTMVLGHN